MSVRTATQPPPNTRELLEAWRLSLGADHTRFAARLGLDQGNWSRIRRGLQAVTAESMRAALVHADEPWRTALAMTWLRENLRIDLVPTARPSVGEPTAAAQAGPKKV